MYKTILILFSISVLIFSCSKNSENWKIDKNDDANVVSEKLTLLFQKLLDEKNPEKEFILGNWNENKSEQHFRFLGNLKTNENEKFGIITLKQYVGEQTKKGVSRIFVVDSLGIIGSYYIPNINDLPQKIENEKLIFENTNNDCNQVATKISFENGIPEKIFRKCNGNLGDIYEFQIEE